MNSYNYNPYDLDYLNKGYNNVNGNPSIIPTESSSAPNVGPNISPRMNTSYAEELLNKNIGKNIKVYMSFSDSIEWRDRIFEGSLEAWGKDFFLLHNLKDNKWYMIWTIYIDFLEFSENVVI